VSVVPTGGVHLGQIAKTHQKINPKNS
jgi:hypothetical protein